MFSKGLLRARTLKGNNPVMIVVEYIYFVMFSHGGSVIPNFIANYKSHDLVKSFQIWLKFQKYYA